MYRTAENMGKIMTPENSFKFEKEIEMKILATQLEFVKHLSNDSKELLSDLIKKYTTVPNQFDFYATREAENEEKETLLSRLDALSRDMSPEEFAEQATGEIKKIINDLGGEKISRREIDNNRFNRIGSFDCETAIAQAEDAKELELCEGDTFIEVHVPTQAVQAREGKKFVGPKESLKELAVYIKKERPETVAVVGRSWLMSTPIASELGFEIIKIIDSNTPEGERNLFNEAGYWGQLIDVEGNVKSDVKKYLFEHKRLPYNLAFGKINVIPFLQKYLPKEERGTIILKEKDSESKKKRALLSYEGIKLFQAFESSNIEELEVALRAAGPEQFKILGEKDAEKLILAFKECKKRKVTMAEVINLPIPDLEEQFLEALDKVFAYEKELDQGHDKEIFIP